MKIKINISAGELTDKISILEIKKRKIKDKKKLALVKRELKPLEKKFKRLIPNSKKSAMKLKKLKNSLFGINMKLWLIEDNIRNLEAKNDFGKKFITIARTVYLNNDKRSEIKNRINELLGSEIKEVKEYKKYK